MSERGGVSDWEESVVAVMAQGEVMVASGACDTVAVVVEMGGTWVGGECWWWKAGGDGG